MTSALAFGLMSEKGASFECGSHPVGIPTHDHDQRFGRLGLRHPQRVVEHGLTGHRMQHFREPRFHTRALTGGENDDG